jgi:hypothetical protein
LPCGYGSVIITYTEILKNFFLIGERKMKKTIMSDLRANVRGVEMISKNKAGNFMFRKGYFYTMGMDEDKFAVNVEANIRKLGYSVQVIGCGNHWTPFNGRAPIQRQSHFWVEAKIF